MRTKTNATTPRPGGHPASEAGNCRALTVTPSAVSKVGRLDPDTFAGVPVVTAEVVGEHDLRSAIARTREAVEATRKSYLPFIERAVRAGLELYRLRELLGIRQGARTDKTNLPSGAGSWPELVKLEFGISDDTAAAWIKLALHCAEGATQQQLLGDNRLIEERLPAFVEWKNGELAARRVTAQERPLTPAKVPNSALQASKPAERAANSFLALTAGDKYQFCKLLSRELRPYLDKLTSLREGAKKRHARK